MENKEEIYEKNNFDMQFKKMIKDIIKEEGYIKEEDFKEAMKDVIEELNPLVAKIIKEHVVEIGNLISNTFKSVNASE